MSDDKITLSDVRTAWNEYNDIKPPYKWHQAPEYLRDRERAWVNYTRVRDSFLIQNGIMPLPRNPLAFEPKSLDA